MGTMIDGETEEDCAVAVSRVGGDECWGACAGVVCGSMPCEAVAGGDGFGG